MWRDSKCRAPADALKPSHYEHQHILTHEEGAEGAACARMTTARRPTAPTLRRCVCTHACFLGSDCILSSD